MSDQSFFAEFSFTRELTREPGNRAFFGRNVLQGLVEGIADFAQSRQRRWERRTYRIGPPVLLGCSPWLNDEALLIAVEQLAGACLVIGKPPKAEDATRVFSRLRELNRRTQGIELRALSALGDMAPRVGGERRLIGPYDRINDGVFLSTIRTIGYRKMGDLLPPIAHAKLGLLGTINWTDEHPAAGVDDYIWFKPWRLWVSSANFTYASRKSAEFGYWTEDPDLLGGTRDFLVRLIGASEDLDSLADAPDPELAPVEFDDKAMAEATREMYEARREEAALRGEEFEEDDW